MATQNVYETYRAVCKRMDTIDVSYKNRSDHLVIADLREGKPVIVTRPFKALDCDWQPGDEFTCDMMNVPRLALVMESLGRILITKQEQTDREEWQRLKPIRETLAPMIQSAANFAKQAEQARGEKEAAEQAAKAAAADMQGAQANQKKAEKQAAEYIASVNLEI